MQRLALPQLSGDMVNMASTLQKQFITDELHEYVKEQATTLCAAERESCRQAASKTDNCVSNAKDWFKTTKDMSFTDIKKRAEESTAPSKQAVTSFNTLQKVSRLFALILINTEAECTPQTSQKKKGRKTERHRETKVQSSDERMSGNC
eukprot:5796619-Amphidinium_carterae.1